MGICADADVYTWVVELLDVLFSTNATVVSLSLAMQEHSFSQSAAFDC